MSLVDDVRAIWQDDTLTRAERKRQISVLCAQHVYQRLREVNLPRVIIRGPYTVVIQKVMLIADNQAIAIWMLVTKNGKFLPVNNPVIIPRPSLLVRDPLGPITKTYTDVDGNVVTIKYKFDGLAACISRLAQYIKTLG